MKIKLAYLPSEERKAKIIRAFICALDDGVKVHESDTHPPYKHLYITTKKPGKLTEATENS